jgi:hypothetical protein
MNGHDILVMVSVDDQHLGSISEVSERLIQAGLQVDQELAAVGIIIGRVDESSIDALRAVEGVRGVDRQQEVGTAPPPDPQ